jgi:hypothetical protein
MERPNILRPKFLSERNHESLDSEIPAHVCFRPPRSILGLTARIMRRMIARRLGRHRASASRYSTKMAQTLALPAGPTVRKVVKTTS